MSFQTQVSFTNTFNASTETIWNIISEFNALPKYVAAIKECTLRVCDVHGIVRTSTLVDGTVAEEKLDVLDSENKVLTYSLVHTDLPVEVYSSTMELKPIGENQCELHWTGKMTPRGISKAEIEAMIMGFYVMGVEGLNNLVTMA